VLERLKLRDVGPADEMELELSPRRNIVTGDNGLGKSFLLDVAWWALTGSWSGNPALPRRRKGVAPIIELSDTPPEPPYMFSHQAIWDGLPIDALKKRLDDWECRQLRCRHILDYQTGRVDLRWLERESPFVARELRRCGLLLPDDVD
jgi:hypothetical protein